MSKAISNMTLQASATIPGHDVETAKVSRLLLADRVIDWQALMQPLLRIHSSDESAAKDNRTFLRFVVLRELQSYPELALEALQTELSPAKLCAFLDILPVEEIFAKAGVNRFCEALAKDDLLVNLRTDLRQQITPWLSWIQAVQSTNISWQIARELLVKETSRPAAMLLADLRLPVTKGGQSGGQVTAVMSASLHTAIGAHADRLMETGLTLIYETARLAKKSGIQRLLAGKANDKNRIRRQGTGRLREKAVLILDTMLRSALRNIHRNLPLQEQLRPSAEASQPLVRVSLLLRMRGRLYLASGDYERGYRMLLVSAAWGGQLRRASISQAAAAAQLSGRFVEAESLYRAGILDGANDAQLQKNLGQVLLALGRDESEAVACLARAGREAPGFNMAHQNLAGMYDPRSYVLRPLDRIGHPLALLYDAYNLVGERLIHIGEGERGVRSFGAAIRNQEALVKSVHLPAELRKTLNDEYGIPPGEDIRILPYEWVTLIGHIAMLDSYLKVQKTGLGKPGRPLLLAPANKVVNKTYLDIWGAHVTIIKHPNLVDDLFPYQRCYGDCFNGYLRSDGTAGDWTELGALGQIAWDAAGHGPLIQIPDWLKTEGTKSIRKMGLGPSDWFVALHIRGTGYHREDKRSMQTHRNAAIEDYLPAIKAITDRGGWVIRMGDASMDRLPPMEHVIDYPHTEFKTEQCDIFLAATARFFIGTTSGLTNTVMSFGTPCLLVNCISNYFQLWNNRVLFTVKPLWNRVEKRYLTIAETVAENFRWKIFNINRLEVEGLEPHANTAEEIEAATIEMLERVARDKTMQQTEADAALKAACENGGNPNYFGNGRLSQTFFTGRQKDLFPMQPASGAKIGDRHSTAAVNQH